MVMQAIAFHVFTVQLVNEFYHTVTRLNSDTPNGVRVHIFIIFVWATTGIIKMIIFNYICEKVCTKVHMFIISTQTIFLYIIFNLKNMLN